MTSTEDLQVRNARDIVARRVLRRLADGNVLGNLWEDYPEVGEHDWVAVTKQVERLAERLDPADEKYDGAYAFLAARANEADL